MILYKRDQNLQVTLSYFSALRRTQIVIGIAAARAYLVGIP